jgi:glycosyltransferase involved in cell wall biosynthesis
MKICIISTIYNAHVIRWETILSSKGHDITIISSDPNPFMMPNVNVIECLMKSYEGYCARLLHQIIRTIRIRAIVKDINPDVVHIHSLDYIHPLIFGIVNFITRSFPNLIVSTWGTDVIGEEGVKPNWRGTYSKRFLLKQAKEITATSRYLARKTATLSPNGKKIHVIPFGIDCSTFQRLQKRLTKKKVRIGFIKSLAPKYGPDYLLKAFAEVLKKFPEVHLIMVGHGSMDNYLRQLAAELNIEKHITFTGYWQYKEIPKILSKLDIFVMPSVEETFGVAALEAQAMEIPVVATKVGGVPEAVLDGKTGILVEPKNVGQLASAIKRLIENPDLRKRMGKNGRHYVLEYYNIADNVVLFEKLYKEISHLKS